MLCNQCGKNEATVHTITYINGIKNESYLCSECAKKNQGLEFVTAGDLLKNFIDLNSEVRKKTHTCPNCGMAFDEFEKKGLLGCSECYHAFEPELEPIINRIHGNVCHQGDVPKEAGERILRQKQIEELQQKLQNFVVEENYEQAAIVRDEIAKLKEEA